MTASPKFYVKRTRRQNWEGCDPEALRSGGYPWKVAGYTGWTGPIAMSTATREAKAWDEVGWDTEVVPSTPETRATVRAWERQKKAEGR